MFADYTNIKHQESNLRPEAQQFQTVPQHH